VRYQAAVVGEGKDVGIHSFL